MKGYLGTPGAFLAFPYVGHEDVTPSRTITEKMTVGGVVYAYLSPAVRRSWSISTTGLRPYELDALRVALAGPMRDLYWISPPMQTQNALTLGQSTLTEGFVTTLARDSEPVTAADGTLLTESLSGNGTVTLQAPVIPGSRVCFSAWAVGSGQMRVTFKDRSGASVGSATTTALSSAAGLRRVAVIGKVPTGAAWAVLEATSVTRFSRPSLTWTPWLMPWSYGLGTKGVVITQAQEAFQTAWMDPRRGARTDISCTVTEVG